MKRVSSGDPKIIADNALVS